MTPQELKDLVTGIDEVLASEEKRAEILASDYAKAALSESEKTLQEGEAVFRPLFRKALMAGQDIPAGTVITSEMLYAMRPQGFAGGLPSEEYNNVIGKTLTTDLKKFDPITTEALETVREKEIV